MAITYIPYDGLIIKKKEAISLGLKWYFTGKPCKHGHFSERNTASSLCKQCGRESCQKFRQDNAQYNKDRLAKWYEKNADHARACSRNHYHANRERNRERRAFRNLSPERAAELKAISKAWRKKNPRQKAAQESGRRARKRGVGGRYTAKDIQTLCVLQKWKCANCSASIKQAYHVNHIIPLILKGPNDRKNLQILCPSCNSKKSGKHPIDFARENGRLL